MAFTEVNRLATTLARTSALNATNTFTLPAAPASGQWIVVALYTNRGIIPGVSGISGVNNQVFLVSCGSVSLNLLESALSTSIDAPTVFAAPYASGMTTTLSVTWANTNPTTIIGVCALIFSGAQTSNSIMNFRQANGAFDGAGGDTFGLTQAQGSSGVTTWANSNNKIPTNYNTQEPFIAAIVDTSVPTSTTLQVPKSAGVLGVIGNSSGQLSQLGGTPGTLPISSTTSVYNPAGATAYGVIYGTYGNFTFSYTGVSGSNLTGCIATGLGTFANAPAFAPIMLAGTSTVTITAILNTTSSTVPSLNGFLTGSTSYTSGTAGANGHVQIGIGGTGTTPARLHLIMGTNTGTPTTQTAYAVRRINGTVLTTGGGFIYTLVPTVQTLSRVSSASQTFAARAVRLRTMFRTSSATRVLSSNTARLIPRVRTVIATSVRVAVISRQRGLNRSVRASTIQTGRESKSLTKRVLAASVLTAQSTRQIVRNRQLIATSVRGASSSRVRGLFRSARATSVPVAYTIKRRSLFRTAVATTVRTARSVGLMRFMSHAGQAEAGFTSTDTRADFSEPLTETGFTSSDTRATISTGSVEGSINAPGASPSWGVKE